MNNNRIFEEKKSALLELLSMAMPGVVIMEVLGISQSTLTKYLKNVQTSPVQLKEAKPRMLLLFARLTLVPNAVSYSGDKNALKNALANALEEQKILEVLNYALPAIYSFTQPRFASDVPMPYQRLLQDIFGQKIKNIKKIVWNDWLSMVIHQGTRLVSEKKFVWGNDHFVHNIISIYAEETRNLVAPIYTKEVVTLVDAAMRCFPERRYNILCWTYGFFGEIKTQEEIATWEGHITAKRVGELLAAAKIRIKRYLSEKLRLTTWQENYLLKIHYQAELDRTEKIFKEAMIPPSEDKQDVDDYTKLLLPIKDLGVPLSTRLEHIFTADEVNYLWELVSRDELSLKKFRNFGKKSADEVRQLVKSQGYEIGMKFLPAEIAYFNAMTYGKER